VQDAKQSRQEEPVNAGSGRQFGAKPKELRKYISIEDSLDHVRLIVNIQSTVGAPQLSESPA